MSDAVIYSVTLVDPDNRDERRQLLKTLTRETRWPRIHRQERQRCVVRVRADRPRDQERVHDWV